MTTRRAQSRAQSRAKTIAQLIEYARQLFAQKPNYRSVLLAYAQYWNDNADDEVHARVIASEREVPAWPHVCGAYDEMAIAIPGEACWACDDAIAYMRGFADDVDAWEPYCHEHGSQDQDTGESYLPYAIAVRRGDGIDVELVGTLIRPAREIVEDNTVHPDAWRDPKARALFAEVCAHARDDGPRAVLADYLLESRQSAVDPRGEYLTLALAANLDAAARVRRDQLLAANLKAWLHPLGAVIPTSYAAFERGFLARADVYATAESAAAVRAAAAWGTVERIRYLPGSVDLIDPAMTALRAIGPVTLAGLERLAEAEQPWAIEELHVRLSGPPSYEQAFAQTLALLARAPLPHLHTLVFEPALAVRANSGESFAERFALVDAAVLSRLFPAPQWPRLQRVVILPDDRVPAALDVQAAPVPLLDDGWRARRASYSVPWLAFANVGENGQPAGWEVAFGPDDHVAIAMIGWHAYATRATLAALVRALPSSVRSIELVSTAFRECTQHDVDYVRDHAGREVTHQLSKSSRSVES